MEVEPQHIVALRKQLAVTEADPTPYQVAMLEAAMRIHDAHEILARMEERQKDRLRRHRLPDGYAPVRGDGMYEYGFRAPDGMAYGFWVQRGEANVQAWTHLERPDEFDDPGEAPQHIGRLPDAG